jgi:hypothetical protein
MRCDDRCRREEQKDEEEGLDAELDGVSEADDVWCEGAQGGEQNCLNGLAKWLTPLSGV